MKKIRPSKLPTSRFSRISHSIKWLKNLERLYTQVVVCWLVGQSQRWTLVSPSPFCQFEPIWWRKSLNTNYLVLVIVILKLKLDLKLIFVKLWNISAKCWKTRLKPPRKTQFSKAKFVEPKKTGGHFYLSFTFSALII